MLAKLVARPLLAGAIAASAPAPVSAIDDIFLKLDGIEGESQDSKHKNEIDVLSYTQAFRNTGAKFTGGSPTTGKVTCGSVTVLKNIDKSSPQLIEAVVLGKHIRKGVITFRKAGKELIEYYVVTMNDVFVEAIDQTDTPDASAIVERVSLNAAKFDFKYTPQKEDGTPGPSELFSFDCVAQKAN
jgi:type VI secretion system secreted protein Hcp